MHSGKIYEPHLTIEKIDQEITGQVRRLEESPAICKGAKIEDYEHLRITKEKDIPRPEPTIRIAGGAVASRGNLTGISAPSKGGKTAVAGVVMAGAISITGDIDGFPDLVVEPNPDGKAVINMDTEQAEADQQDGIVAILNRAGYDSTPDHFLAYNIRKLSIVDYQPVTSAICKLAAAKFGGIHLILIDGGADYIRNFNDQATAYDIIQFFIHLAITHDCPVIVIVHQNPGSDKERGHFGTELQRKCFGLLSIKKEGDVSTLEPKMLRKAGNGDIPLINFQYDKMKGYHVQVNAGDPEARKDGKQRERIREICEAIFEPIGAYTHTEAVSWIMNTTSKGETTAKTMLKNMWGWGYLSCKPVKDGGDGLYRRVNRVNEGQSGVN